MDCRSIILRYHTAGKIPWSCYSADTTWHGGRRQTKAQCIRESPPAIRPVGTPATIFPLKFSRHTRHPYISPVATAYDQLGHLAITRGRDCAMDHHHSSCMAALCLALASI